MKTPSLFNSVQKLQSPFFTFCPTPYPICQIILWTVPSQNSQTLLTLSLLLILVRAVICSPLDYCSSTVALNEALFSNPNRGYLSMNGEIFFLSWFWEGSFARNTAKYPARHRMCPHETQDYLVRNASHLLLRKPAIASSQFAPNSLCFKKELITLRLQILQYLPMVFVILIITYKALDNLDGPISDRSLACSQPQWHLTHQAGSCLRSSALWTVRSWCSTKRYWPPGA